MPTPRKPTAPTAEAIDQFCACFDALFARREERQAFRHYLIGLLLPRERNLYARGVSSAGSWGRAPTVASLYA